MVRDALWLCGFLCLLAYMQNRDIEQEQVTKELSKITTQCLSDSTGRPVTIDGEIYLCGIVATGQRL